MENIIVKIPNFKLNVFRKLIEQSLLVDTQLMLEITPQMIKSCSFSQTKSFMKLWTMLLNNLIVKPELETSGEVLTIEEPENNLEFVPFNFYILKGDLFNKYVSVHTADYHSNKK